MNSGRVNWPRRPNLGTQAKRIISAEFAAAAGGGELKQGQVVSRGDDGMWYILARESIIGSDAEGTETNWENTNVNGNGVQVIELLAANPKIIPGTLVVSVEGAGTQTHNAKDNGRGRLVTTAAANPTAAQRAVRGWVDYETGAIRYERSANLGNGNALLSYRHGEASGKSIPRGIMVADKHTLSATEETSASVLILGEYDSDWLVWPAGMGAAEQGRMIDLLADNGVYING